MLAGLSGCGGNSEDPKTPADKNSPALSPMDELQAIPKDLDAEVAALTKPIDDVQSVIDDLGAIPKKYGIAASDMAAMAKATFDSGKVEVKVKGDLSADAKKDIEAALNKLNGAVTALKATPDRVAALTAKTTAAVAKVPVLAGKVTASATATAANPFGKADEKAKAKADMDNVQKVQADVMKSVQGVQAKVVGIPAMATAALAKLSASFST